MSKLPTVFAIAGSFDAPSGEKAGTAGVKGRSLISIVGTLVGAPALEDLEYGNSQGIQRFAQPEQIGHSSLHYCTVVSKDALVNQWLHNELTFLFLRLHSKQPARDLV
jgi:hypothetical protein